MQYIKDFQTYSLNEQLLNEKFNLKGWKRLFSKIKKDLNLNFFFISTFGMTIEAFFPIIGELFENQNLEFELSKTQICLLTVTAIVILLKENKESIKKLKEKLKEENILHLLEDTIKSIKSIKNILGNIFVKLGHLLTAPGSLIDLFAYTSLLIPSITIFKNLIQEEGISINNIIGLGLSYSLAFGSLIGKQLIIKLTKWLKNILGKKEIKESNDIDDNNFNFIDYLILEILSRRSYKPSEIIKQRSKFLNVKSVLNSLTKLNNLGLILKTKDNKIELSIDKIEEIDKILNKINKKNKINEDFRNDIAKEVKEKLIEITKINKDKKFNNEIFKFYENNLIKNTKETNTTILSMIIYNSLPDEN